MCDWSYDRANSHWLFEPVRAIGGCYSQEHIIIAEGKNHKSNHKSFLIIINKLNLRTFFYSAEIGVESYHLIKNFHFKNFPRLPFTCPNRSFTSQNDRILKVLSQKENNYRISLWKVTSFFVLL